MSDDIGPEFIQAVSEFTGVPAEFLQGDSIRAVWDSAQRAVDWKQQGIAPSPPRPTAAVSMPSDDRIVQMFGEPPADWMVAWRSGQLAGRGAPAPPPRRTGGTAPQRRAGLKHYDHSHRLLAGGQHATAKLP